MPPLVGPVGLFGTMPTTVVTTGFDQSPIVDLRVFREPGSLHIKWDSTAPAGSWYQIYINGRLVWDGPKRKYVDIPFKSRAGHTVYVSVGVVGDTDRHSDFGHTIDDVPSNRVQLSWQGGTALDPSIKGFNIYMSTESGGPYSLQNRVGNVKVVTGPDVASLMPYSWTSGPLRSGTWQFAVAAYDSAGNEDSDPPTWDQAVSVPPPEVAPRAADGKRLWVDSYDQSTNTYTLGWTPIS